MLRRLFIITLCLVTSVLNACPVPVFRYALERWEGDPFQVIVFYRGTLDASLDKQLKDLEPVMEEHAGARANCKVTRVDVAKPMPPLWQELWDKESSQPLPRVVMCTPEWRKGDAALWSGPCMAESLKTMVTSPKREALVQQLLKGTAVVWLVVETSDLAANKALQAKVDEASSRLLNEIIIPPTPPDGVDVRSQLPVEVSFAKVTAHADDPQEAMLMRLLNNNEPIKEPMLFPFFGRGRALAAMPASTVNKGLLDETARFLCSACSCQVKAQNPGFDLLVLAEWESIFGDQTPPPPETKPREGTKPQYVPIPARRATP
jgi:hypothetical protein